MTKNILLKIEGMHCKSCAAIITMGLAEKEGIQMSQVSFEDQQAHVDFDDKKISEQAIVDSLAAIGYKSKILI